MLYPLYARNQYGRDDMAYWDGFLSGDDINTLLALPEWHNKHEATVGSDSGDAQVRDRVRISDVSWVGVKPEIHHIWDKISTVVSEVNRRFFNFDLSGFHEPLQLGCYSGNQKGHYDWHTDASPFDMKVPRKLSMALLLSDPSEFEGGEFQVKIGSDEVKTLDMVKGRAWFFPSYVLHRVAPVTKGIRRSAVLWVGGPPFK
jgi:PKHD-type hydroxylase